MEELLGLKVLVTGAAKRLGGAISLALAEAGCDVAIHYHASQAEAASVSERIQQIGRKSSTFRADLSKLSEVQLLADKVLHFFGNLDVLVHSASPYPDSSAVRATHSLMEEDEETFDRSIAVNAKSAFFLIQKLAPSISQSRNGNIVTLLDQSISKPFRSRTAHSIGKFALHGVTQVAALSLSPQIRVNGFELGMILPPEGLSGDEAKRRTWVGAKAVEDAICSTLKDKSIHNRIIRIGIPSDQVGSPFEDEV